MMAVVLLLVVLMRGVLSTDVRKCCPNGTSLANTTTCAESNHRWLYGNLSYGLPECEHPSLVAAEEGIRVACLDSFDNGTFAALVCPNSNDNNVTVPTVNLIPKCCPLGRKYNSSTRNCPEEDQSDRRTLQHFMNVVVSGFSGIVDVDVGFPKCSNTEVIVDYLVPDINLRREESEAVRINVPGESRQIIFNPKEICVDATENHSLLVVRACQDAYQTCTVKGETCLNKCCQEGFHLAKKGCQPTTRGIGPLTVYNVSGPSSIVPLDGRSPALFHGAPCPNGKYILNPANDPRDANVFDVKGRVYLSHYDIFTEDYCFEDVFRPSSNINGTYVFICFPEEDEPAKSPKSAFWIPLGLFISCFFLLVTLVVYACLPSLQNLHGKTLMCYVASLLSGYLCLASMQLELVPFSSAFISCIIIGSAGQFAMLASFCWLNVISFDIWWTFGGKRLNAQIGKKTRDTRRFILYSIYGWGAPTLLTASTQISDYTSLIPNELEIKGFDSCWFSVLSLRHILFFFIPQILTVGSNVVFYILTAIHCSRVKNELNRFKHTANEEKRFRADVGKLMMNVKLFVVMGISWVMDIVSIFAKPESWGWFLADLTNSLLGLLIFCIFVLKKKVGKALKRRFGEVVYIGQKGRLHRPSTSTLFTVISADNSRINNQVLTKSASDSKLNIVIKKNNLNVSISDFNGHK